MPEPRPLRDHCSHLRTLVSEAQGMCTDARPHEEINAVLDRLQRALDVDLASVLLGIAQEAIDALEGEEFMTEQEFGIGDPTENYHERSQALRARLAALDDERKLHEDAMYRAGHHDGYEAAEDRNRERQI
jgi:hypothetical protein